MTLTDLVPTLEVCQQLKAAGFPQDTALVWVSSVTPKKTPIVLGREGRYTDFGYVVLCAAPTAGELEEWLMCNDCDNILAKNESADGENAVGISCNHSDGRDFEAHEATEIEAKAALVLEAAG